MSFKDSLKLDAEVFLNPDIVYNSGFIVVLGKFSTIGADDRHVESEYRVARDALGLDIVLEYTGTDLLSHSFSDVTLAEGNYYIRARQRGEVLGWGEWSVGVKVEIKASLSWLSLVGSSTHDDAYSLTLTGADIYSVGKIYEQGKTKNVSAMLARFDLDSNLIWNMSFLIKGSTVNDNINNSLFSTVICDAKAVYASGTFGTDYTKGSSVTCVTKTDFDSNLIWQVMLLSTGAKGMAHTSESLYIVSNAQTTGQPNPKTAGRVIKLSKDDGRPVWELELYTPAIELTSIDMSSDFICTAGIASGSGYTGNGLIVKISNAGVKLWSKYINGIYNKCLDVKIVHDAIYMCGINKTSWSTNDLAITVIKLDLMGNKIWAKRISRAEISEAVSIAVTDDAIYLGGNVRKIGAPTITDGLLVKLDLDGNKVWDITISTQKSSKVNCIKVYEDSIYVAGSCDHQTQPPLNCLLARLQLDPLMGTFNGLTFSPGGMEISDLIVSCDDIPIESAHIIGQLRPSGGETGIINFNVKKIDI